MECRVIRSPTVVRGAWGFYYAQIPMIFMPVGGGGKTTGLFCFFDSHVHARTGLSHTFPDHSNSIDELCEHRVGCPESTYCGSENFEEPAHLEFDRKHGTHVRARVGR